MRRGGLRRSWEDLSTTCSPHLITFVPHSPYGLAIFGLATACHHDDIGRKSREVLNDASLPFRKGPPAHDERHGCRRRRKRSGLPAARGKGCAGGARDHRRTLGRPSSPLPATLKLPRPGGHLGFWRATGGSHGRKRFDLRAEVNLVDQGAARVGTSNSSPSGPSGSASAAQGTSPRPTPTLLAPKASRRATSASRSSGSKVDVEPVLGSLVVGHRREHDPQVVISGDADDDLIFGLVGHGVAEHLGPPAAQGEGRGRRRRAGTNDSPRSRPPRSCRVRCRGAYD